jgi:hypothetical protein
MKKSELRKLIQEQIKNLYEQPSSFVCMNLFSTADAIDDGQSGLNSSEGYCVNTVIGSGGSNFESLFDQFQNAGFGTYTTHSTLEECISSYNAGGNCNQGYEYSVYPPPTGGVGPIGPGGIKGPQGNLYTNYANKPKGMATAPSGMAPMNKKRGIKMAPAKRMMRKQIREMVKKLIMEMPTYSTAAEAKNNCWMGNGDCLDSNGNMLACSQSLNIQTNTFSNSCGAPIQGGGGTMTPGKDVRPSRPMKPKMRRNRRR